MLKIIRIGGVPEHFNVLWHYALDMGYFVEAGIDLRWTDYPSGSAPLAHDMDAGVIDLAVILTESITRSIINDGNKSKIVSLYVESPLLWGIHVGSKSPIVNPHGMEGKKYAISRLGSGSHLMAIVDAKNRGYEIAPEQFVEVKNLDGAVDALTNGKADLFLWEEFTTKPLVDNGTFRRIGECPTPWPAFVIAGGEKFLNENKEIVETLLGVIRNTAKEFSSLKNATSMIAEKYGQKLNDVNEWFKVLSWSEAENKNKLSTEITKVVVRLEELEIIKDIIPVNQIITQ